MLHNKLVFNFLIFSVVGVCNFSFCCDANKTEDSEHGEITDSSVASAVGKGESLALPEALVKNVGKEKALAIFLNAIVDSVKNNHVVKYENSELLLKAVEGFLSNLDPHTSYLNEKTFKSLIEQTDGQFGGIGTEIIIDSGLIRIVTPIDDTPAYKEGLKSGDYVICIDDEYINGISADEAVTKLRGKPGTKVKLKIKRTGKDPFDVEITRDIIKIQSVKAELLDGVGYIRISSFDKNTTKDMLKFIQDAKRNLGDKFQGVILDMRNNPGGLLDEAYSVADAFLDSGKIVTTKGRVPATFFEFNAKKGDVLEGKPVVVLVNSGTASAPEIVAAALQDNKRAIIVGTRTFGKGSVQSLIPLSNKTGMKITIAMHYKPSGECIQCKGVSPDVEVKPASISELKDYTCLREENIKHAIGGLSEESAVLTECTAKKIQKENEQEEVNQHTVNKIMEFVKDLFGLKNVDSKSDREIRKKVKELSKSKEKSEDDDFDLLCRKLPLEERIEKDLQLRESFTILRAFKSYSIILKKQEENKKLK